jgi:hypothetical protein
MAGNAAEPAGKRLAISGHHAISCRQGDDAGLLPMIQPISWYWLPTMVWI